MSNKKSLQISFLYDFSMYFYLIFNFDFLSRVKKSILAVQNGQFRLHIPLLGGRKKSSTFWCFYWLISSALARWFQKCIHVHSKYCSKWMKNLKNLREIATSGKLQVPGGFSQFSPTCNNICYRHVYIFGISGPRRSRWANKNNKKLNFFSRSY